MMESKGDITLAVELLSVSGLQEEKDYLRKMQLYLIYGSQTRSTIDYDLPANGEGQINAEVNFEIGQSILQFKESAESLVIYISQKVSLKVLDTDVKALYQPAGLTYSSVLLAQAVIDSRLAILHRNDVLSAELVPSTNDGILDTAFRGAIYLKLSLRGSEQSQLTVENPLEVEKVEDSLRKTEQYMEKASYEQYQTLKNWYSKLRSHHPFILDRKIKILSLDEFGRHRFAENDA